MTLLKLKPEISPHYAKHLSPRWHMTRSAFEKIIEEKIGMAGGKMCEACRDKKSRIELHEGFTIKDSWYYFEGFYLLCSHCHDLVHSFHCGSQDVFRLPEKSLPMDDRSMAGKYGDFKGKSIFKSEKAFSNYAYELLEHTFYFNLSEKVYADYSAAEQYGLSPKLLHDKFLSAYNPFEAIMQYLLVNFQLSNYKNHKDIDFGYGLYKNNFDNPYEEFLNNQYLRHHDFFVENKEHIGRSTLAEKAIAYVAKLNK